MMITGAMIHIRLRYTLHDLHFYTANESEPSRVNQRWKQEKTGWIFFRLEKLFDFSTVKKISKR